MASNNNPNNQPRRKRNKKPVKRYSEEYSNRPNPYTGYSSDGNYHPGAKKRSMDEASATHASPSRNNAGQAPVNYDYGRAAMADAVLPPASSDRSRPAAKPVPSTAGRFTESGTPTGAYPNTRQPSAVGRDSFPHAGESLSSGAPAGADDLANLAETAAHLEGAGSGQTSRQESVSSRTGGSSHRKKNTNRKQSEQARKAKTEARKAAVKEMAEGVVAAEQRADEAARAAHASHKPKAADKTRQAAPLGGVNWDEFYDAAFPPKEPSTETAAEKPDLPTGGSGAPLANGKRPNKPAKGKEKKALTFDEVSEQSAPMTVKPVMLGEDDALPYDLVVEDNAREAEETQAANASVPDAEPSSEADASAVVAAAVPDFTPVLDFTAPAEPSDEADDTVSGTDGEGADTALEGDIGEIFDAALRESATAVEDVPEPDSAEPTKPAEQTATDVFDRGSVSSEGWHEMVPPAAEDIVTIDTSANEPSSEDDSVSLLSQRLLESYMAIEDAPLEYVPEDHADEEVREATQPGGSVDLNQFFGGEPSMEPVEVEVSPETQPQEVTVAAEPAPSEVEIALSDIESEIFAETDISQVKTDESASSVEASEASEAVQDASREKLEKIVEAAEIAEVLRQESEDQAAEPQVDIFSIVPPSERGGESAAQEPQAVYVSSEDEMIRQYQPKEKTPKKDENVFESVLIVDDSRSVVDNESASKQDDMQFLHSAAIENPTAVFKVPEGAVLADIDDADFQEEWLGDEEDGDEVAARSKRAKRRISAFIGGVAILFAIMILVSALGTVITGFNNLGSTNEKKTEYSEFIEPVVLNDPAPFETLEKADNQMLLESAIWRVLGQMSQASEQEYTQDATGKVVVPAEKVAQAGRELFGGEVELNMNVLSESDGSAIYYYDSIDNSFHISIGGIVGPSAVITKMAQKSDYVSLVVGYVLQDEMTLTSSDEVDCYKYMEYVLAFNDDGTYYIQSIRNYVDS